MTAAAWGIPELDPAWQAESLSLPVTKWGTRRRDEPMRGTWHFYTHDYKFTRLWQRPFVVPESGCKVAVEPNFTLTPLTPPAVALHLIYRKRFLARYWQRHGVRMIVDLNLDAEGRFHEIGLLGVPKGWKAYATRKHRGVSFERTEAEFDLACRHAGGPPFFTVFGGGRKVKADCLARGWHWVPEHRQVVQGIEAAYG